MALALDTAIRTSRATAIVTAVGASGKIKFYNGTQPATGAAPGGTLLATVPAAATFGTVTSGVLTMNAPASQATARASYVAGTPTFVRITTSADAFVADLAIADVTWAGTIATGVDITFGTWTITEGNA